MVVSPYMLLCGVGLLAIFSSTISKSPALPLLVNHLGGDPATIGAVAAVSAVTGILFSLPAGLLSDRIGRKRMLLAAGAVFATAPFLYLMVQTPWQLVLVRFYHGLATAIFIPVALALVADLFRQGRGEKMGWFSTATLLGRFSAPAVGGVILGFYGMGQDAGFQVLYLICGATGVAVLLGSLILPGAPPAPVTGNRPERTFADGNWRADLLGLLRHRAIMATCGVEAAILFAYGVFETFLPLHGLAGGLSPYQVGLCLSSQIITVAAAKPVMGRLSDRHGRPPQIIIGALFGGVCIALFAWSASFFSLLFLSVLLGLAISVVTSASAAHIADLSKGGQGGSAMGMLGSVMDIGHSAGPLLGGIFAFHFGLPAAFLGAGVVLTGTGIIMFCARRHYLEWG